jgi:exopolyphosphatase/guanosine-5'-triphosphate,3'-diphosphate pyrophosphatase
MDSVRVAVIDCGTNTFNLLVLESNEAGWKTIFKTKLAVKIGVGGFDQGIIQTDRMARALDALESYDSTCKSFEVNEVKIFATSAVREAKNGNVFVAKVKELFGWEVQVISGDREAELIYEGVKLAVDRKVPNYLIMDIGGGSTEFVLVKNHQMVWKKSYLMGVSRLFEWLLPSSRMTNEEIQKLKVKCESEWKELIEKIKEYDIEILIGSSGSFDTIYDLFLKDSQSESTSKNLHEVPFSYFPKIHQWLMSSTLEERLAHPAIPTLRAEYMQISSYLVKYVLTQHSFHTLLCSEYALKEGVLSEIIGKHI